MKADYVHKDSLTATDYVELNKERELLLVYNQTLLKEIQELKLELEKVNEYCDFYREETETLLKKIKEQRIKIETLNHQVKLEIKVRDDNHWYLNGKIDNLTKENQKLKKQVETCYCNRTDCSGRIKDSKVYDSLVQKIETQQKEFIEWLETMSRMYQNDYKDIDTAEHYNCVLQKYKEIIGVSDENNKSGD